MKTQFARRTAAQWGLAVGGWLLLLLGSVEGEGVPFIRGDANQSGDVSIGDMAYIVSGPPYACEDACDVNDNAAIEVGTVMSWDVLSLSSYFNGGPRPPFPDESSGPGVDPTPDELTCETYSPTPVEISGEARLSLSDVALDASDVWSGSWVTVSLSTERPVSAFSFTVRAPDGFGIEAFEYSEEYLALEPDLYTQVQSAYQTSGTVVRHWTLFRSSGPFATELEGDLPIARLRLSPTEEPTENVHTIAFDETAVEPRPFGGDFPPHRIHNRVVFGDGLGDTLEVVPEMRNGTITLLSAPRFLRGDCNDDGTVDISDAVFSLGSLFLGDGDPDCDDACDSNDDGAVDISDAIATLGVLFLGNGVIPLPGMRQCGVDPTVDKLACDTFDRCP